MKLRTKIFSGFIILSAMLAIAGVWSIIQVRSVGNSVTGILEDNYKSISAAKEMNESLEREDSSILLYMLGNATEADSILRSADSTFEKAFNIAKNNITLEGEGEVVEKIGLLYTDYKRHWEKAPEYSDVTGRRIKWYFNNVHDSFLKVKNQVTKLINMNDQAMYSTAIGLQESSKRAVMPGVIAIIAALVFSLMFTFFINKYVIKPIYIISNKIDLLLKDKRPFDFTPETDDAIGRLANKITTLSSYVLSGGNRR